MIPDGEVPERPERARERAPRRAWLLPAAAFALSLAVRLWRLDESCLWFDELFGLHAARHAWGALARFVALDLVHPPLFYALLKTWTTLGGESVWWLRLLPALVSSLAVFPVALLARELKIPAPAAGLALLLFASSGFLVKYAQEVRMYAPLLLFASCSLWLFARLCRDDFRVARGGPRLILLALTAANLLLVYTHYFGWLLVALELLFAAAWARGRLKTLAASAFVVGLCFAPWAWALARASGASGGGLRQNIGWAARPGAFELFQPYLLLHEPFRFQRHSAESAVLPLTVALALLVFAPALAALLLRELKRRRGRSRTRAAGSARREGGAPHEPPTTRGEDAAGRARRGERGNADAPDSHDPDLDDLDSDGPGSDGLHKGGLESFALRFLVFFSAAPVAAAFVVSYLLPLSVWGTRHLAVVAPAYLLLAAHAVTTLRPRWLSAAALALLGCWLLLAAGGRLARRPAPPVWCQWQTLAAELARAEADGGRPVNVYAAEELAAYHLWHALDGDPAAGGERFRVAVVRNLPGLPEDRAFFLPRGFDEVAVVDADTPLGSDDFWIAFRAPAADGEHPLLHALAARGYTTGPRFEATAQGQRVTLVRARRR